MEFHTTADATGALETCARCGQAAHLHTDVMRLCPFISTFQGSGDGTPGPAREAAPSTAAIRAAIALSPDSVPDHGTMEEILCAAYAIDFPERLAAARAPGRGRMSDLTDEQCDLVIPILFHGLTYRVEHGQTFDDAARAERRKAVRHAWAALDVALHGSGAGREP